MKQIEFDFSGASNKESQPPSGSRDAERHAEESFEEAWKRHPEGLARFKGLEFLWSKP